MTDELVTDLTNDTSSLNLNHEDSSPSISNTADNAADDTFAEESNKAAFNHLLKKIRESVITKRDYGTKFETLIRSWLTRDEAYRDLFSKVMTYADWAREHPELTVNARDIGIDLVGVNAEDPNTFTAIQCKMYEEGHTVSKREIDSFISNSDKTYFTRRFIVATNKDNDWSDNLKNSFAGKQIPITLITCESLATSNVDWNAYLQGNEEDIQKRQLRDYQRRVIDQIVTGFKTVNRGKLIMACGTGKTFTSMKLTEEYVGAGGFVLFLVPSLALLSQTLADWKRQCSLHINAFAVCSDSTTGKSDPLDLDDLISLSQLSYPATTDAKSLTAKVKEALLKKQDLTVIFSTYQSIDVLHEAQFSFGNDAIPEFDLIICDEAHRTAGGYAVSDDCNREESLFLRVHNDSFIKGRKRLYMTATPRIYGSVAKDQASSGDAVIYSMDDEKVFGPDLATVTFSEAISMNCLVDYKVIVLTLDESLLEKDYSFLSSDEMSAVNISNAAKIIGSYRALAKLDIKKEDGDENGNALLAAPKYMKRAVGFARVIETSPDNNERPAARQYADWFGRVVEKYQEKERAFLKKRFGQNWNDSAYNEAHQLKFETKYIYGAMPATQKDDLLSWLREEPGENICKILFNVRCLSEGVDVPSLDAVIFLSPRKSPVDVVQTVGRVMRISPGKKRGYVILPVVLPTGASPDLLLNKNKEFEVVWQVLNALKSIDSAFARVIDGETGKINSKHIEVISITDKKFSKTRGASGETLSSGKKTKGTKESETKADTMFDLFAEQYRNAVVEESLKTLIVKRVGNRREWEDWAEDVAEICKTQINHIKDIVKDSSDSRKALEVFRDEIKTTLNGQISEDAVIEMIGQHIVIKPVLAAIFREYPFAEQNPISKAMSEMLSKLDKDGMNRCTSLLEPFYKDVSLRMSAAQDSVTRQTIIKDIFNRFFQKAFPKLRDKLGIIYTPVEVVDFINRSVADLLKKEFNQSVGAHGIHVLDPFTGTGTFIVRMMESGLIPKDQLKYKYENDLHANEIVPLAYYIASMNIETAYHNLVDDKDYRPNNVTVWTDTFASNGKANLITALSENNDNLCRENNAEIRIIVGNPPYSVGQESQNDNNANEHYEALDKRLKNTYVAASNATLKGSLFDSYIRAYRWAADRIGSSGIIGFITNAGWLDSASADGMRKCMAEEFSSIYVYHLKGNQRTSGERSRQEGGKIFGEGSRAPIAIVFLIKNPQAQEKGKIYFHTVADYLTREQKLKEVSDYASISNMEWEEIVPDKHGDWLNLKDETFEKYIELTKKDKGKKAKRSDNAIFKDYVVGISSGRDCWVYNSDKDELQNSLRRTVQAWNDAIAEVESGTAIDTVINASGADISWTDGSKKKFHKLQPLSWLPKNIITVLYRPFFKQYLYYEKNPCFIERPGRWQNVFPTEDSDNLVIAVNQGYTKTGQIAFITDHLTDIHCNGDTSVFPRYLYISDNFGTEKTDAISDFGLRHFQEAYGSTGAGITKDDVFYYVYGILHSSDYRARYANNLAKELPRIPRVASYQDFRAFVDAGRKLADLHVNYEKQPEYPGVTITGEDTRNYTVTKMKWARIPSKKGNDANDKTKLLFNSAITVSNIPLEAQEYVVNKKSALDWVVEKAEIDKENGIVNDFNKFANDPRYPLALFLKVITVSMETVKIVKSLPPLEIHPLDKE
ncbi:type ISP restriction/modification enzyme [Succinimonas sp.]|uniref:type ISP restriction/modification enzyme n=1 Tax=Succinimonas sp. TaxID=1936151 RepID=UPI00386599FD